jgi:hypothetical protein
MKIGNNVVQSSWAHDARNVAQQLLDFIGRQAAGKCSQQTYGEAAAQFIPTVASGWHCLSSASAANYRNHYNSCATNAAVLFKANTGQHATS